MPSNTSVPNDEESKLLGAERSLLRSLSGCHSEEDINKNKSRHWRRILSDNNLEYNSIVGDSYCGDKLSNGNLGLTPDTIGPGDIDEKSDLSGLGTFGGVFAPVTPVSYTHLRAHET